MGDTLDPWVVLYNQPGGSPDSPPTAFTCRAYDGDHAEEQCRHFLEGCTVVWTYLGGYIDEAYRDYWQHSGEV